MVASNAVGVADARRSVVALYRETLKCLPFVRKIYSVELPVSEMSHRIRAEFENHPHVDDAKVISMLVFKGRQELDETVLQYKSKGHLLKYFALDDTLQDPKLLKQRQSEFLTKFFEGYN